MMSKLHAFQRRTLTFSQAAWLTALERISQLSITIIGDLMVDAYVEGTVARISPEAPVPILHYRHTRYGLGGAANVLMNLRGLGVRPNICSIMGADAEAASIQKMLASQEISTQGIFIEKERPTTLKKRIVSQQHQLLRIDRESTAPIRSSTVTAISKYLATLARSPAPTQAPRALLFSDYAKGIFTPATLAQWQTWAQHHHFYTALDPKATHFPFYQGLAVMTPNLKEALAGYKMLTTPTAKQTANNDPLAILTQEPLTYSARHLNALKKLGQALIAKNKLQRLIITLGAHGMALFDGNRHFYVLPAFSRSINDVSDVSGAGDTVIASYVVAYLVTGDFLQAALLANLAAAYVVSEFGTFAITLKALKQQLTTYAKQDTLAFSIYTEK